MDICARHVGDGVRKLTGSDVLCRLCELVYYPLHHLCVHVALDCCMEDACEFKGQQLFLAVGSRSQMRSHHEAFLL